MSLSTSEEMVIKDLERLAEEIRNLKEKHPQRRPIVIEFSGSPKSGKTSCINALAIFLKRNGFRVSIVHEYASICPVDDKKSPMFNLWTACSSITGMLAALESRPIACDVLILDRGIFDALCWFAWLAAKQTMSAKFKQQIENFLLMTELTKLIDIVYVFTCDPQESIKREFATLLTQKTGSIMNMKVLSEYYDAVSSTIAEKEKHFNSIIPIDTSKKVQNEVSKEVTDNTLKILRDLLVERIGYLTPSKELLNKLHEKRIAAFSSIKSLIGDVHFEFRSIVEEEVEYIQPIPIAVITDDAKSKVLLVKKNEKSATADSPERNKLLMYVGGHSRKEDCTMDIEGDFLSLCRATLCREIKEEIGITVDLEGVQPYVIYTPDSEKSAKHLAICFVLNMDIEELNLRLDPTELTLTRGLSKSGKFFAIEQLKHHANELEAWGIEILKKYFLVKIDSVQDSGQLSLLDQIDNMDTSDD